MSNYYEGRKKEYKKENKTFSSTPCVEYNQGNPETTYELINKYGTYEIQPTGDTPNPFPKISQGLPKAENRDKSYE